MPQWAGERVPGIPLDALDFYEDLEADNSRTWWQANTDRYAGSVRAPLEALVDLLEDEFGPAKLYRPQPRRALRQGQVAVQGPPGGAGLAGRRDGLVRQVGAAGLLTGGGFYPTGTDQVPRLPRGGRRAGIRQRLQEVVDDLRAQGFELRGEPVATRPRGVPADHPRLELMRHKILFASRLHGAPDWLATPGAADRVRDDWRALRPLVDWLTEHVGASENPRTR